MRNNRRAVVDQPSSPLSIVQSGDLPSPNVDEILVRVEACALNFADLLMIQGRYQANPPFPLTPGLEVAGTVVACGDHVTSICPGARIAAQTDGGGLADFVLVPGVRALPVPESVTSDVAAAFQIAHGTSHLSLSRRGRLQEGETLIVLGAAGGVGLTAVEIGKAMGARVIAVARSRARLEICRDCGADILIDSSDTTDLCEALLAHGKADVLYDAVGGAEGLAAQRALRPEGRHLLIGFASGDLPELKPNHLLVKNLDVIGVNWNYYINEQPGLVRETLSELLQWINEGRVRPHIGATFRLDDVADALERLRSRDVTGKIVVRP